MTADVELDALTVRFGTFTAVDKASLRIGEGEFFSFLGPSGCGKTTILRAISGFIDPSEGAIRIGGQDMRGIGANKRPTALIFQSLALFPMMTVAENITYGLRVRGVSKAVRAKKADELLNLVALGDQGGKKVDELSGGQRQRVAIARALAVEPQVLLLDEPLSALDLKLRQHMRNELRAIQRRVGITFIYITHDQGEALTMSDRIAVMNAGRIEQVGDGRSVYTAPRTAFVAGFVGENNAMRGKVSLAADGFAVVETPLGPFRGTNPLGLAPGAPAVLFVRPEALHIGGGENICEATTTEVAYEGNLTHVGLRTDAGSHLLVLLGGGETRAAPALGARVGLGFAAADATVLPPG
ncbi:MAG: ABC transporter ATP-binding protein [Alphaproteobacteria bacterium]|nr:ABC transporter ATP-binding protein [Alphaproteobacteria bacterium]